MHICRCKLSLVASRDISAKEEIFVDRTGPYYLPANERPTVVAFPDHKYEREDDDTDR